MDQQNKAERTYQLITVFEVVARPDRVDGQGNTQVLVCTLDEQIAKDVVRSTENNTKIIRRPGILLSDGMCFLLFSAAPIHFETSAEDAVRSIALGKLSPEEKKSLGFS